MTELTRQIEHRMASAMERLDSASRAQDDYLVEVTLGEIESLRRTARENGLVIPDADLPIG